LREFDGPTRLNVQNGLPFQSIDGNACCKTLGGGFVAKRHSWAAVELPRDANEPPLGCQTSTF
jgi:hypothetical protein